MTQASLRPVRGSVAAVHSTLATWLADPDAAPLTVRTSGSTGTPKDVRLSRRAVLASARATLARIGGPGGWLLALPPHYVAGLMVLARSIVAGTEPAALDEHAGDVVSATAALSASRRYAAVVPTQLYRWLGEPRTTAALAAYDAVLVGGGPLPESLAAAAADRGIGVVATYGMSETCGGCVYDGYPLDGVAVAIRPDGRVRLSGPTLFDGYADRPDLTAQVLRDGWLTTPDLGRLDDDGRLEVLGRVDDVVISGGVNVPLAAVERRLAGLPGVAACAALGLPDAEWGSRLAVVVVPAADVEPPTLERVRDFVAAEHPRSWAPRQLFLRPRLPMLESGKVDRRRLAAELAGAGGRVPVAG